MTNAPERIWIEDEFGDGDDDQWAYGTWDVRNYAGYDVEYVRADIVQALTAERDEAWAYMSALQGDLYDAIMIKAERDRLRETLGKLECKCSSNCDWLHDDVCPSWIARAALKGESHE